MNLKSIPIPAFLQGKTELDKRIRTATAGALVLILLLTLGGKLGAALVAAVLAIGMVYEFVQISFELGDKDEKRMVLLGTTWFLAFVNFWIPRTEFELLLLAFLALFAYFLFTASRHEGTALRIHFQELMFSVFGLLYLGFLPLFLVLIRDSIRGGAWTMFFLCIVWAGDTGAYFAGKRYGRRKLYPHISPKKTWEGALGGLVCGLVVALLYRLIFFRELSWFATFFISILLGIVAPVGDLAESFFKRAFDTKDSGSLLPGHGGFLDRFDGVVFSLPVMYACTRIFGTFV